MTDTTRHEAAHPNPRLTGDMRTDVETALEDLRVVRGQLLALSRVFGAVALDDGPRLAEKVKEMWRRLDTARDVLKTMATKTEAA